MHYFPTVPKKRSLLSRLLPLWILMLVSLVSPAFGQDLSVEIEQPVEGVILLNSFTVLAATQSTYSLESVTAHLEDQVIPLGYNPSTKLWGKSGISIEHLPSGEHTLTVTARDVRGNIASDTVRFRRDTVPVLSTSAPEAGTVYTGSAPIRITATCTDDNPQGCQSLKAYIGEALVAACTPDQPECVVSPGVMKIDREISSEGFGYGRRTVTFEAADFHWNELQTVSYPIAIESGEGWQRVATVPGSILDASEKFILYRKYADPLQTPGGADTFGLYDRASGTHTDLPKSVDGVFGFGRVTGHGAIFTYRTNPGQTQAVYQLFEWRDGQLIDLGRSHRLHKEGDYLGWLFDNRIFLRNLEEGTQQAVLDDPAFRHVRLADVSPLGDVLFIATHIATTQIATLYRWKNGTTTEVFSINTMSDDNISRGFTDGINVGYSYHTNNGISTFGHLELVTPTGRESLPPNDSISMENGWVAYYERDLQNNTQVWLRSPEGVKKQVSFFALPSEIDNLNPHGEVTFTSGSNLYLTGFDQDTERRIWSRNGHAIWLESGWHLWASGSLFKLLGSVTPKLGDVDANGAVDVLDAVFVLRSIVGGVTLTPEQRTAADVIADSFIDVNDAIKILRVIAGLDPPFPG